MSTHLVRVYGTYKIIEVIINPEAPLSTNRCSTFRALILANSYAFLDTITAESMHAFRYDVTIP